MPKRVNDPIDPAFGRHVAELRRRIGMTQLQLANELGLTVGTIQHIEHGRCHVTRQRLLHIARVLPGLTDTEPIPHFLPMRDFWEKSNGSPQQVLHSGTGRQKIAGILGINDLSNLGLYAWNTLTDQVHRDPALKLLMGLPADASPNLSVWKERIRPKDLPNVEVTIDRAKRGDGILYVEYRAFGLDGVERWLAECGRVIFDAARRPVCCIGAVFPLTRRVCC